MDELEMNNNEDFVEDASTEQVLSPESPDSCNIFGDPELSPRVGDQYQVEIPSLVIKPESLWLTKWPNGAVDGVPHDVQIGLPISVMWIEEEIMNVKPEPAESVGGITDASNKKESVKSECASEIPKVEPMDSKLDIAIKLEESANISLQQDLKTDMHQEQGGKGFYPVPGSSGNPWSDVEEASFLLGLYIFGKNLVQVKKFVESKTMGDILTFYYGKFYKSDKYLRWSECRKIRSRRCVYGQRIFTGMRQQELLSRLLPHVSEECKNSVLEVSKTFGEGKMLLEEYVFTLKATFGLKALVEAVGIGKGKEDLTGMTMEPPKSSQVPLRPEVPVGKACSSLTPLEIINFLTGGYRLSKARSNDLFWEAVWPRLLARGWHSEQPNNHGFAAGSRQSLVFLLPGIKKFSRKKLVKGDHYFDSVSDVLSKVASEPSLLELELGADNETKVDQEDYLDQQRHCYLKPRTPNRNANVMKFTVVDTSLPRGGNSKVMELRSLPVELTLISNSGSHSEEDDGDSPEESSDEANSADTLRFDKVGTDVLKPTKASFKEASFKRKDSEIHVSNGAIPNHGPDSTIVDGEIPKDMSTNKCNDSQPRKAVKGRSSQKKKAGNEIYLAPVTKRRRRLSACSRPETGCSAVPTSVGSKLRQEVARCCPCNPGVGENNLSHLDPSEDKQSYASSSSKGSPVMNGEAIISSSYSSAEDPQEKPQPCRLIDLNLPVAPDAETDEPCMMEITERQEDQARGQPPNETNACGVNSEQQPNMNARRQSTRNRPLTTKALEALACGYLSTNPKRKSRDGFLGEHSLSRPSRRTRGGVKVTKDFRDGVIDFKTEERGNKMCDSNGDVLGKLQV